MDVSCDAGFLVKMLVLMADWCVVSSRGRLIGVGLSAFADCTGKGALFVR